MECNNKITEYSIKKIVMLRIYIYLREKKNGARHCNIHKKGLFESIFIILPSSTDFDSKTASHICTNKGDLKKIQ